MALKMIIQINYIQPDNAIYYDTYIVFAPDVLYSSLITEPTNIIYFYIFFENCCSFDLGQNSVRIITLLDN